MCTDYKKNLVYILKQWNQMFFAFVFKYQSGIYETTDNHTEWWIVQNPWKRQNIAWPFST